MDDKAERTTMFGALRREDAISGILDLVYRALQEKGYDPVSQLVGFLLTGDPTYITSHMGARDVVRTVERDEVVEYLVRFYAEHLQAKGDR
ncbi:MAG: IreB family regulatory phosphoprotein [Firmicutes bacterium]|nr:IreB family regulatory phosphoprotein [Bacillota bacterium]